MISPLLQAKEVILLNNSSFVKYINADHPVNGSYLLTEPIDLNKFNHWKPVGNESVPFSVKLYGNYQVINGLNIANKLDDSYLGLFGYLVDSRVERLFINKPVIEGAGSPTSVGTVAGGVESTTITEVINHAGKIKTSGKSFNAGGIVGIASHGSILSNNLATGIIEITSGYNGKSGGIAGSVRGRSIIRSNQYAGKIVTASSLSSTGGIVGELSEHSSSNNNLHTGLIASTFQTSESDYGGIVGKAAGASTITSNLNSGSLSLSTAWLSTLGGIVGLVESSTSVDRNVNAGALHQKDGGSFIGGIAGQARETPIRQNMNNGEITYNLFSQKPIGVGGVGGIGAWGTDLAIDNNLNTARIITGHLVDSHHGIIKGNNIEQRHNLQTGGVFVNMNTNHSIPLDLVEITQNKTQPVPQGLNKTIWSSEPEKAFPMLKNINGNYQELLRLNNTQNGTNIFPAILSQFATPGGSAETTLLDLAVWTVRSGFLPFLKGFLQQEIARFDINCGQGGFACSPKMRTLPTEPSLSEDCPAPEGTPVAQAYDVISDQLYVAIRPPLDSNALDSNALVLARYTGTELDKQFGACGKITHHLPDMTDWSFIGDSLLTSNSNSNSNNSYLHLVANKPDKSPLLLRLPLPEENTPEKNNDKSGYTIDYLPERDSEVSVMAGSNGTIYFAGKSSSDFFISRFSEKEHYRTLSDPLHKQADINNQERISSLSLSPDGKLLYIASVVNTTKTAFLQQYDSLTLSRKKSFGVDGEVMAITPDYFPSYEAVSAVHRGWVYIASITRNGALLSIRRFDPGNGQVDGTFIVDESLPNYLSDSDSPAGIKLCPDGQYLHAVKYDKKGNIFTVTYDDLEEVYRTSKSLEHPDALFNGLTVTDSKMYLPYKHLDEPGSNHIVEVMKIALDDPQQLRSSSGFPVWGYVAAAVATVTTVATIALIVTSIYYKRRTASYPVRLRQLRQTRLNMEL
ncbi:hypothetical protein NX722_02745 [Endozoicomonas gorgoniicola]|uniref:Uncharacterized protein n=1 Tax=Endozoicomonas gorgoniicola TaxID=1234144 RepID=A0ABT3MQD7_9GAMM|nr:hypothetical protein [Endozoicomonas gorgoniicola]MCW7551580.1 hypothetical protein [Endozoicomonas gorgoniicola]